MILHMNNRVNHHQIKQLWYKHVVIYQTVQMNTDFNDQPNKHIRQSLYAQFGPVHTTWSMVKYLS